MGKWLKACLLLDDGDRNLLKNKFIALEGYAI